MAFLGVTVGMVFGTICAFLTCFVYGQPLMMGVLAYSMFGTLAALSSVTLLFLRSGNDDNNLMPPMRQDAGDAEWLQALQGRQASDKIA